MNINKQERDKLRAEVQNDLVGGAKAKNMDLQDILALLDMIDRPAASGDDFAFSRNDDYGAYQIIDKEGRHVGDIFDHKTMTEFVRIHAASAERAPVPSFSEDDLIQEFDLDTIIKGIRYADHGRHEGWEKELAEYIRVECNKAVAAANGEQK